MKETKENYEWELLINRHDEIEIDLDWPIYQYVILSVSVV